MQANTRIAAPKLRYGDGEYELRLPSPLDRMALFEGINECRNRKTQRMRLYFAALGLCWPADQVAPPWKGGLPECDDDLVRFGELVGASLTASSDDHVALLAVADAAAGWCIATLMPPPHVREAARDFSEARQDAGTATVVASGSGTSGRAKRKRSSI